jgi:hypothetical protein
LRTSAKDIITADNEVIIETIREIATALAVTHFPKIKQWEEIIQGAVEILKKQHTDQDGEEDNFKDGTLLRYEEKRMEIKAVLKEMTSCFTGKCKELLRTK